MNVLSRFPTQNEPDSDRFAPHHYLQGAYGLALLALYVSTTEAFTGVVLTGLTVSLFGWFHCWYCYPRLGAGLSLGGFTAVTAALVFSPVWWATPLSVHGGAVVCAVVAWDDLVEHAFGVPTPLHLFWVRTLYPLLRG